MDRNQAYKQINQMVNMDIKYLAGFIDGEGWIGIARTKDIMAGGVPRYFPECRITNTALEILEEIRDMYGVGTHLRKVKKNKGSKEMYQLKFYGSALRKLLDDLKPHIIIKAEQLKKVTEIMNTMTFGRRKLSQEILEKREKLYHDCRYLNTPNYVPTEANLPILEAVRDLE